jgi:hypothetical protein
VGIAEGSHTFNYHKATDYVHRRLEHFMVEEIIFFFALLWYSFPNPRFQDNREKSGLEAR